jgi:hypothetical protein
MRRKRNPKWGTRAVITLAFGFIINIRWNVHVDRLALIGFGSISDANKPDEFGFDIPQPKTTFYDKLPGRRRYGHVNRDRFDAGKRGSWDLNLYPGGIV